MSTTTWIIIIVVIILIIIAIGIAVYFLVFNKPTTTANNGDNGGNIPSNAIKYGDTVSLFNTSNDFGGYAYLCGVASGGCTNVAIQGQPFKQWKIVDTNLNSTGVAIKYGQQFKLQVLQNGENRYLGYCGSTTRLCGTNVGALLLPQETTTWTFNRLESNTNNTYILPNINLEIINTDMDRNKLSICGRTENCGTNVTNFNEQIERLGLDAYKIWQLR